MDELLRRYAGTVLHFPDSGLSIDLRLPLPGSALQQLADLGLAEPFGVITACNPLDARLEQAGNDRLTTVLASLVHERYPRARQAHGRSPDGRHSESGWAIVAPIGELERLAGEFLQNAIFWFDGQRFFIIPVHIAGPQQPLPADRANP